MAAAASWLPQWSCGYVPPHNSPQTTADRKSSAAAVRQHWEVRHSQPVTPAQHPSWPEYASSGGVATGLLECRPGTRTKELVSEGRRREQKPLLRAQPIGRRSRRSILTSARAPQRPLPGQRRNTCPSGSTVALTAIEPRGNVRSSEASVSLDRGHDLIGHARLSAAGPSVRLCRCGTESP